MTTSSVNWKKILFVAASLVVVLIGAAGIGYVLFNERVSESVRTATITYLRHRIKAAVSDASEGSVKVNFDDFSYGFFTQVVSIRGVKVSSIDSTQTSGQTVALVIEELSCTGVSPWDVLNGEGLSLGTVRIVRPHADISLWDSSGVGTDELNPADTAIVRLPRIPNVDSLLDALATGFLPTDISPLTIDAVLVIEASSTNHQHNDTAGMDGRVTDLNVSVIDIGLGTGVSTNAHVFSDVTISVGRWHRTYSDGRDILVEGGLVRVNDSDSMMSVARARVQTAERDAYAVSGALFSFATHRLTIDSFALGTLMSDKEWLASRTTQGDRFKISGEQVAMNDINLASLTNGTSLEVDEISIGGLNVDIFSNKRGKMPKANGLPPMPHQIIRQIPFTIGVDTILVHNATVRYAEQHPRSPTPGVLTWRNAKCVVSGLSSDTNVQRAKPLTIQASGIFMDQAEMTAMMSLPLNVTSYTMHAEGTLKHLDIRRLNSFLPSVEGIKVTTGSAEYAMFRFDVKGRAARGMVDPVYRDLDIELVDKKSKKGNWLTGIVSFVANWLVVKNDNSRGEDHEIGKIAYTIPKDAAIMQTLWFPIRSGLGEVAGF